MLREGVPLTATFVHDPKTAELTDVDRIVEVLSKNGLGLVSNGESNLVLGLAERVPATRLREPRVRLALGYAHYAESNMTAALSELNPLEDDNDLPADDRAFAELLLAVCRATAGLLPQEAYEARVKDIEGRYPDAPAAIHARIEALRHRAAQDQSARTSIISEALTLANDLRAKGEKFVPLAIQAALVNIEARFYDHLHSYIGQVAQFRMTEAMGIDALLVRQRSAAAHAMIETRRTWAQDLQRLVEEASKASSPVAEAEVHYTSTVCALQEVLTDQKLVPDSPEQRAQRAKHLERLLQRARVAADLFKKGGSLLQFLEARMLEVELLWLRNEKVEAMNLAAAVEKAAIKVGASRLAARANGTASGQSPVEPFEGMPTIFEATDSGAPGTASTEGDAG